MRKIADNSSGENRVKKRELMEENMTREQAKQKLISFGVADPTDDQITSFLNSINAETKKEKERADGYKEKADKADELQRQIDDLNNQNLTESEKAAKELEKANQRIAELEKNDTIRGKRANAMEKFGITAEQASKVVSDDGETDYEVLSQIFSEKQKNAIAEFEKNGLNNTPNPGGTKGNNQPGKEKTDDVKNAENILFGTQNSEQSAKDFYVIK